MTLKASVTSTATAIIAYRLRGPRPLTKGTDIAWRLSRGEGDEENSRHSTDRCMRNSRIISALEADREEALQMVRHRHEHLSGHPSASSSAVGPDQPARLFHTSGLG